MVSKRKKSSAKDASTPPESQKRASHAKFGSSKLALHRINGPIAWSPGSIVSMGSSRDGHLCACVRESGRVDLYDVDSTGSALPPATSLPSASSAPTASSSLPSSRLIKSIPFTADASPSSVVVVDAEETPSAANKVRIFVGAMDGTITELDTSRRQARLVCDSHGGAVWGLASIRCGDGSRDDQRAEADNPDNTDTAQVGGGGPGIRPVADGTQYVHKIAAACDDGSVKVFGVEADDIPGVTLVKSFLPVEGRTLCVAWDPREEKGRIVSGGSDGCVHVWDEKTGREAFRINVGGGDGRVDASSAGHEDDAMSSTPCVWTVKVLGDGTIVSGDSLGQVTFWDGTFGTMLAKFNPNGADVLALESSSDDTLLFASGIDPRIAVFRHTGGDDGVAGSNASPSSWAYLSSKREHVLDVRALCRCGERLFSGGNDTLLLSHSIGRFLKEHPRRVDSVPARPLVSRVADGSALSSSCLMIASATSSAVDIWQMRGRTLVSIAHVENSRRAELTAVATSPDGRFVAFGDIHGVQCVELREAKDLEAALAENPSAVPITPASDGTGHPSPSPPSMIMTVADINAKSIGEGVTHLEFLPKSETGGNANQHTLAACLCDGTIKLVSGIGSTSPSVHTIRDIHDLKYKTWFKRESSKTSARREAALIDNIRISNAPNPSDPSNGHTPFMAVTVFNRIFIINLDTRKVMTQIPSITGTIAAIEFVQNGTRLLVATASSEIGLFDTSSGDMCAFPGVAEPAFHNLTLEGLGPVLGIEGTDNPNAVIVHAAHAICHVDVGRNLVDEETTLARLGRRSRDKQLKFDTIRSEQGRNPRVLRHERPILACTGSRSDELITVEGSYDAVWKCKMAPIKRHRYGT